MMTGLIPAGAVPVHCPRMPPGVWGSISISYLCRLLLGDTQTLMSAFLPFQRSLSHTPTHILCAHTHTHTWSLPSGWGSRTVPPRPPMVWPLSPLPVTQPRQPTLSAQVAFPYNISTGGRTTWQKLWATYTHTHNVTRKIETRVQCNAV